MGSFTLYEDRDECSEANFSINFGFKDDIMVFRDRFIDERDIYKRHISSSEGNLVFMVRQNWYPNSSRGLGIEIIR